MQDLKAKLEKLRTEAEDCELIGRLATDIHKRELFLRLAVDLRSMARDIEAMIATRPPAMDDLWLAAGEGRIKATALNSKNSKAFDGDRIEIPPITGRI